MYIYIYVNIYSFTIASIAMRFCGLVRDPKKQVAHVGVVVTLKTRIKKEDNDDPVVPNSRCFACLHCLAHVNVG